MVREVRVLALEDKPWWRQPLLTFPIIGDISVRQFIILIIGLIPALFLTIEGYGIQEVVTSALIGLMISGSLAFKRVKSVPFEKQLLYAITGSYKPKTRITRPRIERKRAIETPEVIEVIAPDSSRIPTIKVFGVLRDSLNNPLANAEVDVFVNSVRYAKIRTGPHGDYVFYYTPDAPGLYEIELKLHGRPIVRKKVKVEVRS
mgnify:FL=1